MVRTFEVKELAIKKVAITQGTADDFFMRGKALAQRLDRRERVKAREEAATITFEEIGDLLHALSPARLELIQAVKSEPGSITSLARRLNRNRSAVTRDVELLRQLGILEVEDRPEPGHHRQKWVSPQAPVMKLEVLVREMKLLAGGSGWHFR
jgi:predicted transcriptional regulator